MFGNIWNGVKSIISGGVRFAVGVGQAAWELMKLAVKVAVWVVGGIFTMAAAGVEYVGKTISKLFTPNKVVFIGPQKLNGLAEFIRKEAEKDHVWVDNETMEFVKKCEDAQYNNEGLMVAEGEDENRNETLADPTFVKADDYEDKIKAADSNNQIYVKRVKVA